MKVGKDYFKEGKSSFLSVDKDLSQIVNKCLQNDRLCKLLYYTQKDCLSAPNLSMQQKLSLLDRQIRITPYLPISEKCPNYIVIKITDFTPNVTNPQFRDCSINFQILCHPDHWNLGDFALRPYKIAGELDSMFDGERMTGIGMIQFNICTDLTMNDQEQGLSILYDVVHGVEDEIDPLA